MSPSIDQLPPTTPEAALDEIVSALRRGDLERAERAFSAGRSAIEPASMLRLAELNFRRQRWADAAWLLDRIPPADRPAAVEMKRTLSRNLGSLAAHRAHLLPMLVAQPASDDVAIAASLTGHPTVAVRNSDGVMSSLSPGNRPLAAAESTLQKIQPNLLRGQAIALCGIGDGYVMYRLAHEPLELMLGMQQPVFVIEPDARVALHALMIHDYTGPDGPIEQGRFIWLLGDAWQTAFAGILESDPFLGAPVMTIGQSANALHIQRALADMSGTVVDADNATARRVASYYDSKTPTDFARTYAGANTSHGAAGNVSHAARRPRVLLVTTLFSTVLQYSTRDAATAFEQLGWEAKALIEPSPVHRLFRHGMRRTLDTFKPDMVFQIDHMRHEHAGLFPTQLPFVCWAQDHLPNLVGDAGKQVGPLEFVLTDGVPTYVHDYSYLAEQCIGLTKLTSVAPSATMSLPAVEDVVFVSNASRTPQTLLDEILPEFERVPQKRGVLMESARRIIAGLADGSLPPTYPAIRELVEACAVDLGQVFDRDDTRDVAAWLYHPFCDAIYRQQTMRWAADACRDLGVSFGLYGKGWEHHPDLAPFARGPIQNGPALHELTARAKISLQVVPYPCLHQRLLDGLCAGGFFLIRRHPSDIAPQALLDFLVSHRLDACQTTSAVRLALMSADAEVKQQFEALLEASRICVAASGMEDPIESMQSWREIGFIVAGQGMLPRINDVLFHDAASLRERIRFTIENPSEARAIAAEQQQSVNARFTYAAGLQRVVNTIRQRLLDAGGDISVPGALMAPDGGQSAML